MPERAAYLLDWAKSVVTGATQRALQPWEREIVPYELASAIDLSKVILVDRAHNPFALGKILVRGDKIYWPDTPPDISREHPRRQAILIHELAHVWQYRTGRLSALGYLLRPRNWSYRYEVREGADLDEYAIEEQADIFEDWYRMRVGLTPSNFNGEPPRQDWLESTVISGLVDDQIST